MQLESLLLREKSDSKSIESIHYMQLCYNFFLCSSFRSRFHFYTFSLFQKESSVFVLWQKARIGAVYFTSKTVEQIMNNYKSLYLLF